MKRIVQIVALLSLTAFVSGCNTISGFGQDIKDGSHAVSSAINGKRSSSNENND